MADHGDHVHRPFDEHVEVYGEALRAAYAAIIPRRRHLDLGSATRIIEAEFASRRVALSRASAEDHAYNALHPFWTFLHPVRARRQGWRWQWRWSKDESG